MHKLQRLKEAKDLSDLAKLLGFVPSALAYVLYKLPETDKYRVFDIPKKGGGTRTIKAPTDKVALAQERLAELLSECMDHLQKENPRLYAASHGFRKKRSIVSNANVHRRRRYVFNVDLADFFGSINFGRVRGYFIKDRTFSLSTEVATVVAQIACHENALPQGSPCSPVVSNLIGNILDARILRLCKHSRCTYTRYADDLTFSTNEQNFPKEIAFNTLEATWEPGTRLAKIIDESGFKINPEKTRMSVRRSRQSVTGLTVNIKPNIRQDYDRTVRAMCRTVFDKGYWHRPIAKEGDSPQKQSNLRPIEGMLSHIHFVKERRDRTREENKLLSFSGPSAPTELYRQFLFYKHFVANSSPIVVTEGISDISYLKAAVLSRARKFPHLVKQQDGKTLPSVVFLNPTGTARAILNLGNGTDGQAKLIGKYSSDLKNYRHLPFENSVVVLCDNDDGSKSIFKATGDQSGTAVSKTTTSPFYHIKHNLYLVKVPENLAAGNVEIEDLFPKTVLDVLVDGKPFDKKKEHGDHTSYGKTIFAEKVVKPNAATIDFSGFDPLLERISDCLIDYETKLNSLGADSSIQRQDYGITGLR